MVVFLIRKIRNYFQGKKHSGEVLHTSIGPVRFFQLNNGMLNRVNVRSTVSGSKKNNALAFFLWEEELVDLSPRKYNSLSLEDAGLVREKVKELLVEAGILSVIEENLSELSAGERSQLDRQLEESRRKIAIMAGVPRG